MIIKMTGTSEKAPAFYISQNDIGRRIGAKLDIETTGYMIKLEGTKPSGATFEEVCARTDDGFILNVTEQMTDEPGITLAQIVLYGQNDDRMGSELIHVLIEPLGGIEE